MSAPELSELQAALGLSLVGLPLLVVALRRAARVLPRRAAPEYRWPFGEAVLVFATPFLLIVLVRAFAPAGTEVDAHAPDVLT
ncbi:MAG: hypothetical protein HOP15_12730, partial [Planctomycetes bacterium]|nr:hypothetical protein [Planctomycetota bacterium]